MYREAQQYRVNIFVARQVLIVLSSPPSAEFYHLQEDQLINETPNLSFMSISKDSGLNVADMTTKTN